MPRILRGARAQDAYPALDSPPSLAQLDSAFQLQEYISLLIQDDIHNVERIVKFPGKKGGSSDSPAGEAEKEAQREDGSSPGGEEERVVDEGCWIYEQLRRLAQDLTHPLITTLQNECNRSTCPEMKAGEWLYLCVAHGTGNNPMEVGNQCCAIDYIIHTLDSATALLNSPRAFPSRISIPVSSHRHFSSLARRLSRIFAHAYFHHREAFEQSEAESSLYSRFLQITKQFELVAPDFLVIPADAVASGRTPSSPPRTNGNRARTGTMYLHGGLAELNGAHAIEGHEAEAEAEAEAESVNIIDSTPVIIDKEVDGQQSVENLVDSPTEPKTTQPLAPEPTPDATETNKEEEEEHGQEESETVAQVDTEQKDEEARPPPNNPPQLTPLIDESSHLQHSRPDESPILPPPEPPIGLEPVTAAEAGANDEEAEEEEEGEEEEEEEEGQGQEDEKKDEAPSQPGPEVETEKESVVPAASDDAPVTEKGTEATEATGEEEDEDEEENEDEEEEEGDEEEEKDKEVKPTEEDSVLPSEDHPPVVDKEETAVEQDADEKSEQPEVDSGTAAEEHP